MMDEEINYEELRDRAIKVAAKIGVPAMRELFGLQPRLDIDTINLLLEADSVITDLIVYIDNMVEKGERSYERNS